MSFSEERNCARCGVKFTAASHNSKFCGTECAGEHHNERRRRTIPEQTVLDRGAKLSADEQMEKLFSYYQDRDSIAISKRPDGTRLVAISDTQFPFVDEPLLEAVNGFIQKWKPNDIIYNGDILDFYEISDFDKRPNRKFTVLDELEWARELMLTHKKLAAKGARLWWIDGNHEERLQRAIWRHAQGFSELVKDIPEALQLGELAEGYVPYGKHVDYLGFVFTHGKRVNKHSAYTARAHFDEYRSSGVNGHTHRLGSYSMTDMHRRSHTWYEMGCLCRLDLEYIKGHPNWQQGFLIGEVFDGRFHPQLVHVVEGHDGSRGFVAAGEYYRV